MYICLVTTSFAQGSRTKSAAANVMGWPRTVVSVGTAGKFDGKDDSVSYIVFELV